MIQSPVSRETVDEYEITGQERKEGPVSVERLEGVLEQGISFLSGIMEIATGKPLAAKSESKKISIDRETGEVVIRFTVPGM